MAALAAALDELVVLMEVVVTLGSRLIQMERALFREQRARHRAEGAELRALEAVALRDRALAKMADRMVVAEERVRVLTRERAA